MTLVVLFSKPLGTLSPPITVKQGKRENDNRPCFTPPNLCTPCWPGLLLLLYLPWTADAAISQAGPQFHYAPRPHPVVSFL